MTDEEQERLEGQAMTRTTRQLLLILSAAIFLLCLTQPAVDFETVCRHFPASLKVAGLWHEPLGQIETLSGLYLFLSGFLGVLFMQPAAVAWLANVFYFASLCMALGEISVPSRRLASLSLILAVVSLPITNFYPLPADEGGVCYFSAISPVSGYWLWLAAIVVLTIVVWRNPLSTQRNQ